MRKATLWIVLWTVVAMLAGCADERNVVKTPVPPAPTTQNLQGN